MKTLTFKDVQEDLGKSSQLFTPELDTTDFQEKANTLALMGLTSSHTAIMYEDISKNSDYIQSVRERYMNQYNIILDCQLQKVCDDYDLYEAKMEDYIGGIPASNVKAMQNFKINPVDLPLEYLVVLGYLKESDLSYLKNERDIQRRLDDYLKSHKPITLGQIDKRIQREEQSRFIGFTTADLFTICSVPKLLNSSRLKVDDLTKVPRLLNTSRKSSRNNQVDLDPIVLFKLRNTANLIVTAWGDEANHDFVINPTNN